MGGLPYTFNDTVIEAIEYTLDTKDRIVEKDIPMIKSLNTETIKNTDPLLIFIALQKPGTISENKISNNLNIPKNWRYKNEHLRRDSRKTAQETYPG